MYVCMYAPTLSVCFFSPQQQQQHGHDNSRQRSGEQQQQQPSLQDRYCPAAMWFARAVGCRPAAARPSGRGAGELRIGDADERRASG